MSSNRAAKKNCTETKQEILLKLLLHCVVDDPVVLVLLFTRSPLNEDVFAAPTKDCVPVSHEEIKDLQAKIYKLFLQVIIHLNVRFVLLTFLL